MNTAGSRPLVNHDVDAVVLHRRVKVLLDHGRKSVNFVDKQHIVRFKARQQSRQVARFVEHRPRSQLKAHPQFVGNDVRERGFTQSRRTVQQSMVQRFAAVFCRFDKHPQVLDHLALSAKVLEPQRAQGIFEVALGGCGRILFGAYVK